MQYANRFGEISKRRCCCDTHNGHSYSTEILGTISDSQHLAPLVTKKTWNRTLKYTKTKEQKEKAYFTEEICLKKQFESFLSYFAFVSVYLCAFQLPKRFIVINFRVGGKFMRSFSQSPHQADKMLFMFYRINNRALRRGKGIFLSQVMVECRMFFLLLSFLSLFSVYCISF